MPDFIGNIEVPEISPSGTFPLVTDHPHVSRIEPIIARHAFQSGNGKIEQRFKLGNGSRRWTARWADLYEDDLQDLLEFWEARKGPYQPFTLNVPSDDGESTTPYIVTFEDAPLTFDKLRDMVSAVGVVFVEVPQDYETLNVSGRLLRFPNGLLEEALTDQVQTLIPLIKIQPKEEGYPPIFLSDRRLNLGGTGATTGALTEYLPRLIDWDGIQQRLGGQADSARFIFGNADRVMRDLAADVDLFRASIEFALYHVGTELVIELWKGEVLDFVSGNDTEFGLEAVDGIYDTTLQYPLDKCSTLCWKDFDGPGCPFSTEGELDLVNFPSATAEECDHGYLTANGCKAHGMKLRFGGITAVPQSVRVKDNSQGFFGIGRPTETATSLVSDSVMNQPLIEIYTDTPMPVKALLVSGRDEGDFYQAVGIVGAGPLTSYARGQFDSGGNRLFHKLDGQPNHGDPGALGLKEVLGSDPAGATDFLSLDESGNQVNGDTLHKVYSGSSTYLDNFAAGVAFVVLRRTDEKGFQLTTLDEHTFEVWVKDGLKGWIWTGPGTRTLEVLTNPVWIAVNVYLRGIGQRFATATEAEEFFDLDSAIFCADICNLTVDKVVGDGTETQFKFQGMLRDVKVLRDWLQEILNNGLCSFIFSNGKLKIVIREDAAAAHSFSAGNMIKRSLRLRPLKPTFNRLVMNFANRDYNFVSDAIPVQDLDHINYLRGRILDSQMNLAGAASKSMAGRIGAVRLKENLGGVGLAEWKKAREGTWKSTVLSLGVEPGIGVSIDDEEVPGGTGLFRVVGWKLNRDYSIDLEGATITDTMYDGVVGPKASDVPANGVPAEFFPPPLKSAWCPDYEQPLAGNPVFEQDDKTFGLALKYRLLSDGHKQAVAEVSGSLAINDFKLNTQPPVIRSQSQANSGGSLQGQTNYWFQVCAVKLDAVTDKLRYSPPSNMRHFTFEGVGGAAALIAVGDIEWPAGDWDGFVVFVGDSEKTICMQAEVTAALPTDISFTGPLKQATYNAPSPAHSFVRAKAKRLVHGGTIGEQVSLVDGDDIVIQALAGLADDWTGRRILVVADQSDGSAPPWYFAIQAYDSSTGRMELTPSPSSAGVEAGDLVFILLEPVTFTDLTIGDPKLVNGIYPDGATPDEEIGMVIRGITPGREHQLRRIVTHTSTVYTVDRTWDFEPLFWIVELPDWQYKAESSAIHVPHTGNAATMSVIVDNFRNLPILVGGFLVDRRGGETPEEFAVVRMGFVFGDGSVPEPNYWCRAILEANPAETGSHQLVHNFHVKIPVNTRVRLLRVTATAKTIGTAGRCVWDHEISLDRGDTWDSIYGGGSSTGGLGDKVVLPQNEPDATLEPDTDVPIEFVTTHLYNGDYLQVTGLEVDGVAGGIELVLMGIREPIPDGLDAHGNPI